MLGCLPLVRALDRRDLLADPVRSFLEQWQPLDQAVQDTGMEYGGITPIGLPAVWPVLVDSAVVTAAQVVVGSGLRRSKLVLPGAALAELPGAEVLSGLAQPAT